MNIEESHEKAKILYNILSLGIPHTGNVDEDEVRSVMETLAPIYLSGKYYDTFQKINEFYERMNSDEWAGRLIKDSDDIAGYIKQVPFVKGILPAGQFYCDMYDPVNRRFMALYELVCGKLSEFDFSRRDLPDYDFIAVIDVPMELWSLQRNTAELLRFVVREMAENSTEWDCWVNERLVNDYRERLLPISTIKLTADVSERLTVIDDYLQRDAIAVCFGNPIPAWLWQDIHYLVYPKDYELLNCLRDCLIGCSGFLYADDDIDQDVLSRFQVNYLLHNLDWTGNAMSVEDIVVMAFHEIAGSMPGRPRHDASHGLVSFSRNIWRETFSKALSEGLVEAAEDEKYMITEGGRQRAADILRKRQAIEGRIVITDDIP